VPKELVRVEVHATVKAIAVIEVAVRHQDLEVLKLLQRLPAQIVASTQCALWRMVNTCG
jgi:hypothetical protein